MKSDVLDAMAQALPDPALASEEFIEAVTTDDVGRRVKVRYYKLKLRAYRNTWHFWCPEYAGYLDD